LLLIGKASTMTKMNILLLALLFAACKSPSKAFNQGNYTDAIERAVRTLQRKPNDAEARHILQSAYTFAVNQYEEKIRNLSGLNSDNRWEQLYHQYSQLQRLYDKIQQSPAAVDAAKPVNYASYLTTYADKSAEVHVQKAAALLENRTGKDAYREAYYELRTALNFKPNDDGILKKLRDAKEAATVNILLMPIDVNGSYRNNTSYAFRNFEADLVRCIRNGINNDFLNFMTPWDSRSTETEPDEVAELRLGSFFIGRPYDESKTRTVTKEVVVKETVYSKDSVVKEYAKVTAHITTTKRLLVSTSELFIDVRDPEERTILWRDKVQAEHRWATEFATYTGDERALSDSDKALLNKKQEMPPREDEIVEGLLHRLTNNATQRLRSYYSRY
jgi:hypothetical protein